MRFLCSNFFKCNQKAPINVVFLLSLGLQSVHPMVSGLGVNRQRLILVTRNSRILLVHLSFVL